MLRTMFVRRKPLAGGRTKVQVVKSVRDGSKVRQRVVRHVGTASSDAQLEQLEALGRLIIEEIRLADGGQASLFTPKQFADMVEQSGRAEQDPDPFGVDLSRCREEARVAVGVRQAFGEVYAQIGWDRLLGARRMSANRNIKEMALARIARPQSKRASVAELERHGQLSLNLDHVYRSMDLIDEAVIEAIRRRSREVAQTLLPEPAAVVFYDITTLQFESELEGGDRFKGFSKDGKPHRVQVVFALLAAPEGLPIGYELFPGNTYEGGTLIEALDGLERRHPGTAFTVVADAAMISRENQQALQRRGTPYILGARLKSRRAAERELILDLDGYEAWNRDEYADSVGSLRCIADGESRLVVTHSPRRARKDERDRRRKLERLRDRLARSSSPASQCSKGNARFLDFPEGRAELNEEKIAAAAAWDGLRGIVAWGCGDADPRDLVVQYRRLSEIEACFRANKHDLKIRPIFHWRDRRIRAHIAICYMAFCCLQHLRHRLAARGHRMSPDRIRRALNELEISVLCERSGVRKFGMPSAPTEDAERIYRTLGLAWNRVPFEYAPPRKPRGAPRPQ